MIWMFLLFTFVLSSTSIITIHRSMNARTACDNPAFGNANHESVLEDILLQHENCNDPISNEDTPNILQNSPVLIYSIISALLVGLSGIFPLILFHRTDTSYLEDSKTLNRLLSFAVGGLLGDVFLHLLPESWNSTCMYDNSLLGGATINGLWVLFGLICFCLLEKCFPDEAAESEKQDTNCKHTAEGEKKYQNCNGNNNVENWSIEDSCHDDHHGLTNGSASVEKPNHLVEKQPSKPNVKMSGYLNLFANFVDNFTHGLAIGGSYLVSRWVGFLTTGAILLHEIPHEIGDFAILLRAGFDRWEAAKYQLLTATGGLLGAVFAHVAGANADDGRVAWILPFTSGGFIYIALCSVVPDLLKETSPKESFIQLILICSGIGVMGLVTLIE